MSNNTDGLKKSSFLPVLIITTLAIGLYLNTLNNDFVYDDVYTTIVNNTFIKSFDNLLLLFDKTAYFGSSGEMSYRPVVTFTYFIDYALYGLKPWGYHQTNVLLHAINGVLLYFFINLLLTPHSSRFTSLPFLISILFVTHPVLTEAVNCISYREDLLVFLFYMVTLSLYLISRQPTSSHRPLTTAILYLLSCLTYLLALLSKEMAVTLPLIILCYEWLYGKDKTKLPSRLFNRYNIGYIAITLFYLYLRFYIFHNPEEQVQAWGLFERFFTMPWLIMSYLKLSLIPVHLSADYVINPVNSPFSLNFILSIIVIVSIFTIIILYSPFNKRGHMRFFPLTKKKGGGFENGFLRQRSILFGALFFLIALIPVYNIVPISNPLAERYLYLPLVGFIIGTVFITYIIAEKLKVRLGRYMPVFFLVVSIIFSFSVVKRNTSWNDEYSLWSDTVAKMPNSSRAHYNLGNSYKKEGQISKAFQEYKIAQRLNPKDPDVYANLGAAYFYMGQLDEAVFEYKAALHFGPNSAKTHYDLGNAYSRKGQKIDALQEYMTAIKLMPDYPDPHHTLGNVYSDLDMMTEAIQEYNIALKLKPSNVIARYRLGNAYAKTGLKAEARREFETVLKLAPSLSEARKALESLD